ncbi:uncharacterized protein K460DRAFT_163009 [Cucurbitaria berberidis CBS 394.84]|uniref:Uncharacterized protein n=1 Tax=Cucurbitaria berberidis CBS 394.84 TaxID=1168544 RepID=A0A9P4GFK9_9PLEO|nr:uncharacterized protein K460DRAFT_163009 [Cucurbitaria berberidis CBS 394.84]KAF1844361.1 hypothetical protein K460DRAFT_163009 [Cucurbitaria berberidis CBS 394.84]
MRVLENAQGGVSCQSRPGHGQTLPSIHTKVYTLPCAYGLPRFFYTTVFFFLRDFLSSNEVAGRVAFIRMQVFRRILVCCLVPTPSFTDQVSTGIQLVGSLECRCMAVLTAEIREIGVSKHFSEARSRDCYRGDSERFLISSQFPPVSVAPWTNSFLGKLNSTLFL